MKRDGKGRFVSEKAGNNSGEEKVYAVGFKGFEPGLICRGKQYAENTVFEEPEAELCKKGMHFCENPLDVFRYYAPAQNGKITEFATVEALAPCEGDGDKKVTTKLRIGAKLTLGGLIDAAVKFCFERVKWLKKAQSHGDYSAAQTHGWGSAAQTHGDYSAASATGKESFAVATGRESKVKGALGCFIACAEWREIDGNFHPVALVSGKVDGKKLKADTWYTVKNGRFVEVEE